MIFDLISSLFGIGKTYLQNKAATAKNKALIKKQELQEKSKENQQLEENVAKGEQSIAKLDAITLKQIGWLDDLVVVVTMLSILLNFIPQAQQYMTQGFEALSHAPQYYQYAIGAVYVYVLGFKSLIYRILIHKGGG